MNKNRTSFLSVGIPSMCTIFSVLCLVILALLTLNTSEQDLQTSRLLCCFLKISGTDSLRSTGIYGRSKTTDL